MTQFLRWLSSSFDNNTKGASSKKLTAFALSALVVYLHYGYASFDNAIEFLIADLAAILGLLGVNSWEQLKRHPHGQDTGTTG